jgi:predicted DNA-binding transcriptional regulator YafY
MWSDKIVTAFIEEKCHKSVRRIAVRPISARIINRDTDQETSIEVPVKLSPGHYFLVLFL